MELDSGATRTSVRFVVDGSASAHDIGDNSSTEAGPLAAISRKFSPRKRFRQRDRDATTSTTTLPIQKVNNTGSSATSCDVTSSNEEAVGNGESRVFTCPRDVTGNCRPQKKTPDHDDVTVTDACGSSGGPTGNRTIDNSGDIPPHTTPTPTSGYEDGAEEVRVRFRFDSVSCKGAVQKDVSSTLPKEPHPVRDQTVHRRCSSRDEAVRADTVVRCECVSDICLNPPQLQRTLSNNSTEKDVNDVASPRGRWTFRRHARGRQRQKPSCALRKEIKAARQLGVIMGAFTVCFLPYFVHSARAPPRTKRRPH